MLKERYTKVNSMKKMKKKKRSPLYKFLLWVTNNEVHPKHEVEFDIAFFLINTLTLVVGCIGMYYINEKPWMAILIIEYTWSLDTLRNNRTYIK